MDESLAASKQAYRQYLQAGRPLRAAMAAMFLGGRFSERGDLAVGSGWMSRMRRLLHDQPEDANGFGLSFRDPDNIALELWAPLP